MVDLRRTGARRKDREQRPPSLFINLVFEYSGISLLLFFPSSSLSLSLSVSLFSSSIFPLFFHHLPRACYCIIYAPVRPVHERLRHHHGSRSLLPAVRTGSAGKRPDGEEV
ncbi:hypothetical protein LZ31DRAFT_46517 [Colletotrichum somersetense]|nr:hypothetical protein LZ31DRAFT_46517 [Colletotrichum somersetense]